MPASRLPSSMPALASRSSPWVVAVLEIVQIGLLQPLTRVMSVFVVVTCHVSRVVFCVTVHSDVISYAWARVTSRDWAPHHQ